MITTAELHRTATVQSLRFDQVEKDYIVLWILYAFARSGLRPEEWIFKGGTALRHCYYPGYRFSEDIDFTCAPQESALACAQSLLNRVARWVQDTSGIRMAPKPPQTIPGDFQVEIPIEYSRGGPRAQGLPAVKIHLTFDEPILTEPVICEVKPQYPDLAAFWISVYSKQEIVAEKMRALLQQQKKWPRPRDLYDLWFILCRSGECFSGEELKRLFVEKCRVRRIQPDRDGLISENLREWNRQAWHNLLGPMLKVLPNYDEVWREWVTVYHKIWGE